MQEGLPTTSRMRAAFDEVLAGDEFRYAESTPWARWLQAIVDLLREILSRWWPDLGDSQLRLISWVALTVIAGMALLLIHRWASGAERRSGRGGRQPSGSSAESLDARDWASRARAAAAEGRYREAATGLYQATILELDAAGRLRYRDWKTPGDYALEISGEDAVRTGFLAFLADFVTVAFGPVEPDASAFASLSSRAAVLGSPV
jgi:hypothetical protein